MSDAAEFYGNTYLTFYLDHELFGLNIQTVREVLDYTPITRVPMTADFMRGVINVRGHVVPVVDLRQKFGLTATEHTVDTCIIIVELEIDGEISIVGALVDGVQEVLEISSARIAPPPRLGTKIDTRFMQGIGKLGDRFVMLLDIQAIFSMDELFILTGMQDQEAAEAVC